MMKNRILAIDFGGKRTGLAISDNLRLSANPLETVQTKHLMQAIQEYEYAQEINTFLIGEPKCNDGSAADIEPKIQAFIVKLQAQYPESEIIRHDERLTSIMAQSAILDMGYSKSQRRDKGLVDQHAALLILSEFLQSLPPQY